MAKTRTKIFKTTSGEVVYGIMAEFADPAANEPEALGGVERS